MRKGTKVMEKQLEMFINWGCTPLTQHLADKINALDIFPAQGEVEDKKNNPALEKFRKAQNVVYDIFNNGLGNKAAQCFGALGIRKRDMPFEMWANGRCIQRARWDYIEEMVEEAFTPIVIAAAKEQGII